MPRFLPGLDPIAAYAALRVPGGAGLLLDGRGGLEGGWPLRLAAAPRRIWRVSEGWAASREALAAVDARIEARRKTGGPGGTGIALLIAYEAFENRVPPADAPWTVLALEVDASLCWLEDGTAVAVGDGDGIGHAIDLARAAGARPRGGIPPASRPRSSLPREAYLAAASRIKEHIVRGDIYQANLTQRLSARWEGDPLDLYDALAAATPAPRSALVEASGMALASVSPEIFIDVSPSGRAETRPIKGTRPRGGDPEADAAAAAALGVSEKDRAELTMIVDLERNDLGRVARAGTVRVPELGALRSYPAVHHLVARVEAVLREGVGIAGLVEATFPGGSITGAPKIRAMDILRELEPTRRGLYTGSLFWLDDDGSTASSILIRSAVLCGGEIRIGAGGGIVADSDPEAEWMESNAKARALTRVIGFEPEEAR